MLYDLFTDSDTVAYTGYIFKNIDSHRILFSSRFNSRLLICNKIIIWHVSFFYGTRQDKWAYAYGMMVSDHRRPRLRVTSEELQMRCRSLRWRYMRLLKVPRSYRPGNTAARRHFHSCVVRGRNFLRNRRVVKCRIQMVSNLGPIPGQSVFWREVLSRSVGDS